MLVDSEQAAKQAIARLTGDDLITMDCEATGKDWRRDRICSIQLYTDGDPYYFPFRHGEGYNLPLSVLDKLFSDVLRPERPQEGFHYGFDIKICSHDGMRLPRNIRDPMLAAHQMNENEWTFKLKDLACKYLGRDSNASEQALLDFIVGKFGGSHKTAKGDLWRCDARDVYRYGVDDVLLTRGLMEMYAEALSDWHLTDVFREVCDFQLALCEIEMRGMPINLATLDRLEAEAAPKAAALRAEIERRAKEDLGDPDFPANPNSHPQMKRWLGTVLGVPDTSRDTLALDGDERGKLLLDFRTWHKIVGSFVTPWREKHIDGRLHCNFYITSPGTRETNEIRGTVSDRVSCTDPNMQQVPPMVREACEAPEGFELVEFDYSQLELRIAAHYYEVRHGDSVLADILRQGYDQHQHTADGFGIPRKKAKVRNFAIQYGAGATTLARKNGTDPKSEARYLNHYHKTFPGCRRLSKSCESEAKQRGYIRLWSGRVRHYDEGDTKLYKASNNLIQGGAAQILRRALVRIHKEIPEANMVLTVHDSIVFMLPKGRRDLIQRIRTVMQTNPEFALPMIVDVKVGPTWGTMHEIPRDMEGLSRHQLERVFALCWAA